MGYVITGDGPTRMKELAVKLKTADPVLKRELCRALKDAGGVAADAARGSILATVIPSTRNGGTSSLTMWASWASHAAAHGRRRQ